MKLKVLLTSISTLLIVFLVPQFGDGTLTLYMVILYFVMLSLFFFSKVKLGAFFLVPIIISVAFIYVMICDDCPIYKRGALLAIWLAYFSAIIFQKMKTKNNINN